VRVYIIQKYRVSSREKRSRWGMIEKEESTNKKRGDGGCSSE